LRQEVGGHGAAWEGQRRERLKSWQFPLASGLVAAGGDAAETMPRTGVGRRRHRATSVAMLQDRTGIEVDDRPSARLDVRQVAGWWCGRPAGRGRREEGEPVAEVRPPQRPPGRSSRLLV
jgi:hypothetical protein